MADSICSCEISSSSSQSQSELRTLEVVSRLSRLELRQRLAKLLTSLREERTKSAPSLKPLARRTRRAKKKLTSLQMGGLFPIIES